MSVQISVIGVILAALAAMAIGSLWYSPALFGKTWRKALGLNDAAMKQQMKFAMPWLIVASLVTAYVLNIFIVLYHHYMNDTWLGAAVLTAVGAWLGFAATAVIVHGVFEPRDRKVMYINIGNRLATLLAMGLILAAFLK